LCSEDVLGTCFAGWAGGKPKMPLPREAYAVRSSATVRGLGAVSSLEASLASRRLSGCRGANGFDALAFAPGAANRSNRPQLQVEQVPAGRRGQDDRIVRRLLRRWTITSYVAPSRAAQGAVRFVSAVGAAR
jgi:hypothetical protein